MFVTLGCSISPWTDFGFAGPTWHNTMARRNSACVSIIRGVSNQRGHRNYWNNGQISWFQDITWKPLETISETYWNNGQTGAKCQPTFKDDFRVIRTLSWAGGKCGDRWQMTGWSWRWRTGGASKKAHVVWFGHCLTIIYTSRILGYVARHSHRQVA